MGDFTSAPGRRSKLARALCAAALLAVLAPCALAVSPAAAAELSNGNALSELTKSEPEATTAATTTATTAGKEESTSNSSSVAFLAIGAAGVLLVAILFVIMRDVRRVAPAGDLELAEATVAHDAALKVRKRRSKAKAARQQRKRNRR